MKPCLLLGSFDPPHTGHMHLISEALNLGAEKIYIIPAWGNPWKESQTQYQYRLRMCKFLENLYPTGKVEVLDVERTLAYQKNLETVPTWMVLEKLKEKRYDFKVISTNETYPEVESWERGDKVLTENEFLILSSSHLGDSPSGSVPIIDLPVSSSMIRLRLSKGQLVSEYLPDLIYQYVHKNKLYEKISLHY